MNSEVILNTYHERTQHKDIKDNATKWSGKQSAYKSANNVYNIQATLPQCVDRRA